MLNNKVKYASDKRRCEAKYDFDKRRCKIKTRNFSYHLLSLRMNAKSAPTGSKRIRRHRRADIRENKYMEITG